MNQSVVVAIRKAEEVRITENLEMDSIVDIHKICSAMDVNVFYNDINMEGWYINGLKKAIVLSNKRPLVRRIFTCAHELGHHVFGHGTRIDSIGGSQYYTSNQQQEEFLVDTFAGSLLIPLLRLEREIRIRKLSLNKCFPIDFMKLSCLFGVGYQTLIYHCQIHKLISRDRCMDLLKITPKRIFKRVYSNAKYINGFKIFDNFSLPNFVELEQDQILILPANIFTVDLLSKCKWDNNGHNFLFRASDVGTREILINGKSIEIRIQPRNFTGLAVYRFDKKEQDVKIYS